MNAKLGVWMEACDSQNLSLSPILSRFGIYSDSLSFPSCEVVEWKLASFFGKMVSTPAEMCPMMPRRQVGVRDVVRS